MSVRPTVRLSVCYTVWCLLQLNPCFSFRQFYRQLFFTFVADRTVRCFRIEPATDFLTDSLLPLEVYNRAK